MLCTFRNGRGKCRSKGPEGGMSTVGKTVDDDVLWKLEVSGLTGR